jgi:3-carboxy-cis,cis-muconate cycloisomerase
MPSTVYDSALFRDMFGTPEMRAVFSDEGYLQACLDTEAALARAQASVGMIPIEAASEITAKAQTTRWCCPAARTGNGPA